METNSFSYKNIYCYIENGEVTGILIGFKQSEITSKNENKDFIKAFSITQLISLFIKYMLIKPIIQRKKSDRLYIQNLSVDENHRGEGIGTKLIEYFIQHAVKNKEKALYLDVSFENKNAKHLYKKIGFSVVKTKKILFSNSGYFQMKKDLK